MTLSQMPTATDECPEFLASTRYHGPPEVVLRQIGSTVALHRDLRLALPSDRLRLNDHQRHGSKSFQEPIRVFFLKGTCLVA